MRGHEMPIRDVCARDETRTHTAISSQGGLSPPRLPFRHLGLGV